jgi:hypothetical protein
VALSRTPIPDSRFPSIIPESKLIDLPQGVATVPAFFALTLFVSATLLFLVQPMVGKMILPLLGGTPAVWNTCMVFFQALLLAGYFYAHRLSTDKVPAKQTRLHFIVMFLPVIAMLAGVILTQQHSPIPIVKSLSPQGQDYPFFGVILLLTAAIGMPFFVVSTTAPLLQKWFAFTGHPASKDPYFLYGASNFGSLLALVGYPAFVEPNLRLIEQAIMWGLGYVILVALCWRCGKYVREAPPPKASEAKKMAVEAEKDTPPPLLEKLRWLVLAFVPSSLMLGVTTFVSTDIASLPLLWIIPLALYLITFIIVFSRVPAWIHLVMTLITPVMILLLVFIKTSGQGPRDFIITVGMHMLTFFLVTMTCHGELARSRPSARHLTSFYLIMSLGGMLGGMFNGLVAPIVFIHTSEYPLTLIAACFVLPVLGSETVRTKLGFPKLNYWDIVSPLVLFIVSVLLVRFGDSIYKMADWFVKELGTSPKIASTIFTVLLYGVPAMACYFFVERPVRFGLCVAAVLFAGFIKERRSDDSVVWQNRSFFGTLKVEDNSAYTRALSVPPSFEITDETPLYRLKYDFTKIAKEHFEALPFGSMTLEPELKMWKRYEEVSRYYRLVHGTTLHGMQLRESLTWGTAACLSALGTQHPFEAIATVGAGGWESWQYPGREPLTYYHRTGPVGWMFETFRRKNLANTDVACIGLGTGSLSSYGLPGQRMTFFEIDTVVRRLVESPTYFTYIDSAKKQGVNIEFEMGDARLKLEELPADRKFGFILVDAFSSDSIPVHLLTQQAVELFFNRLDDDGIVALHISNRYLELEPVVYEIAEKLGLEARIMNDNEKRELPGQTASSWIAVAKTKKALGLIDTGLMFPTGPGMLALGGIVTEKGHWTSWKKLESVNDRNERVGLWTDDFSPFIPVVRSSLFKLKLSQAE